MTKDQRKLFDLLMSMKILELPKALREYLKEKSKDVGMSGGVISDLIEIWITES